MSLGETLRAAREHRGLTLEQASEDTKIRQKFLRALEQGDYQQLPGAVYTRGFLRNYGEYLDLDTDELIAQYQAERGAPEPIVRLQPIRPIMRRSMVFTPGLILPLVVTAAVFLFVGYLYYQFVSFAVPPRLEVSDPPTDTIAQQPEYVVRGRTVTDAKISVTVFPGPERLSGLRPSSDGTFAIRVPLKPGANHIEIDVLDTAGKVNSTSRVIRYEAAAVTPQGPQVIVEQPANGATYTDGPVTVSGRVEGSVDTLLVNSVAVRPDANGRFSLTVSFAAGRQVVRVVARSASGAEVQEQRNFSVAYTRAVVLVEVRGGNAWLLAVVDGAQDARTNKVYPEGTILTFNGKEVRIRSGNAGATYLTYNGQAVGVMGTTGEVQERTFTQP